MRPAYCICYRTKKKVIRQRSSTYWGLQLILWYFNCCSYADFQAYLMGCGHQFAWVLCIFSVVWFPPSCPHSWDRWGTLSVTEARENLKKKNLILLNEFNFLPKTKNFLQVRILEWIAMPSSRESSQPRDQTPVSITPCIDMRVLYYWHNLGSPSEVYSVV